MTSITALLERLPSNDPILWADIGTELRSEQVRLSAEVTSHASNIVDGACSAITAIGEARLMTVRALVNFVADNDFARDFMTLSENSSCNVLWGRLALLLLDSGSEFNSDSTPNYDSDPDSDSKNDAAKLSATVIILILQFFTFTENESRKNRQEYFVNIGLLPSIAANVSANIGDEGAELLNHFFDNSTSPPSPQDLGGHQIVERLISTTIRKITSALKSLSIDIDDDDDEEESTLTYATLIYNLSGLLQNSPPEIAEWLANINIALALVPNSYENVIRIKRHLFAATGILSSVIDVAALDLSSFAGIVDAAIVDVYESNETYVFAGACVTIGNCIMSAETRSIVETRIEAAHPLRDFLATFFCRVRIDDPVQLQCIHAINNLVDIKSAPLIMDHADKLCEIIIKPAIDNQALYADPARLCYQFARRILRVHFMSNTNNANVMDYKPLWSMLVKDWETNHSSHAVGLVVLQSYVNAGLADEINADDAQFLAALITIGINLPQGALSIDEALEIPKTIGMLMHVLSSKGGWQWLVPRVYDDQTILVNKVVVPLTELLKEAMRSEFSNNEAFVNNTRFVAATVAKLCDQWLLSAPYCDASISGRILATKNEAVEIAKKQK